MKLSTPYVVNAVHSKNVIEQEQLQEEKIYLFFYGQYN